MGGFQDGQGGGGGPGAGGVGGGSALDNNFVGSVVELGKMRKIFEPIKQYLIILFLTSFNGSFLLSIAYYIYNFAS